MKKFALLIVLVCLVALSSAKPDRYLRKNIPATVCHKGHWFKVNRCWRPCPSGYSTQWNNWYRCQRNCKKGEKTFKGRCYTRRCIKGFHSAAGKCYADACPRGFVPLSSTHCQRPCPKPYTAIGRKCVNKGAKPGQCDSYTRPSTPRASRPYIVYVQATIPRPSYWPFCPRGWDMVPTRRCLGPCKPTHKKVGVWCKNKKCFTSQRRYSRGKPIWPTVCPKGSDLRNHRCWFRCPAGWMTQWNNWFRCQVLCKKGERHFKGRCYTRRCIKGYHSAAGKCYANACPRGFVPLSATHCQRPCPKPYKAIGRKCVNKGAKPGQCDSYTRPSTLRASRPYIVYVPATRPKKHIGARCPGGWRMEGSRCRRLCKAGYTIRGDWCELTICIGI